MLLISTQYSFILDKLSVNTVSDIVGEYIVLYLVLLFTRFVIITCTAIESKLGYPSRMSDLLPDTEGTIID